MKESFLDRVEKQLNSASFEEAKKLAFNYAQQFYTVQIRNKELENAKDEMYLQFSQMKDQLKGANDTIKDLLKQLAHSAENYSGSKDLLFGRSTETFDSLMNSSMDDQPEDPLSEDSDCSGDGDDESDTGRSGSNKPSKKQKGKRKPKDPKKKKPKEKGKEARELSSLPSCTTFQFDRAELDEKYGADNWRVCFWHEHVVIDVIPAKVYQKKVYTPVVVIRDRKGDLVTVPYEGACLPGCKPSAAFLSMLANDKFGMFLPLYRQEHDPGRFGFTPKRGRMCRWLNQAARDLLKPVYEDLMVQLLKQGSLQIDETTYLVIDDGRDGVHKSYIWVHRSSELLDEPPVILYSYEPTRSAQHLRDLFAELKTQVNITCDAYSAYFTIASELLDLIYLSGCLAHCRRRFVKAFMLLNPGEFTQDALLETDEVRAIEKIADIYYADEKLKNLSPEERLLRRQTEVKPFVDDFFFFIHSCNPKNPLYSDKMKDAISYAINQEKQLRRFLEDGSIPIDNSSCERAVKSVAMGRKNYLFSYSIDGANSNCIIQTLIETAEANRADPRIYLEYVLHHMSQNVYYGHTLNIEDMRPWSSAYQEYETKEKLKRKNWMFPEDEECPTPVKPRNLQNSTSPGQAGSQVA